MKKSFKHYNNKLQYIKRNSVNTVIGQNSKFT